MPSQGLTTGKERLRRDCGQLVRELEAVLCLSCALDQPGRANRKADLAFIETATKKELQTFFNAAEGRLFEVRQYFRVTAKSREVRQLYKDMKDAGAERVSWLPLFTLRSMFVDYSQILTGSERFPAHARVSFDPDGTHYPESPHPEIFLLEASLFEDMAALYNMAGTEPRWTSGGSKQLLKQEIALSRATVLASLHFVEAYLNGVAFDCLRAGGGGLSPKQRDELADWDTSRDRPMYLSLSEKFLAYQRIILNVKHAPLQESNCHEWQAISKFAKQLRDALAHPSAGVDPRTRRQEKELAILSLSLEQVTEVVDSAVGVVRRLNHVLARAGTELWWLHDRDASGRFPVGAFD